MDFKKVRITKQQIIPCYTMYKHIENESNTIIIIKQPNQKYEKVNILPTDIISEQIPIIGYVYNV